MRFTVFIMKQIVVFLLKHKKNVFLNEILLIMLYLNIIVFLQIILFFGILYFKNGNVLNKILGVIILIPGLNFLSNTFNLLDVLPSNGFGAFFFITLATGMLFAPLVFYYIHLLCAKSLKKWFFLFGISALIVIYTAYLAIEFFTLNPDEKFLYIESLKSENVPENVLLVNLMFIIMQQIYFTISVIKVYKFKNQLSNVFSSRSNVKIEFTQRFIVLIWSLNLLTLILYATIPMHLVEFVVLPFVLFFINSFLMFYAFQYQVVFEEDTYANFVKDISLMTKLSIKKNVEIPQATFGNTIDDFLKKNKTYLQTEYTIFDLAKDLKKPQRTVSDVINQEIGKSFSDLINSYRVEESKVLLIEKSEKLTIDAIAKMSGFKSRATFYRVFKDKTSLTPAQYIKEFKLVS